MIDIEGFDFVGHFACLTAGDRSVTAKVRNCKISGG